MADNYLNKMRQAAAVQNELAEASKERRKEDARAHLSGVAAKKITTTLIASLAKFEEHFGSLWGHGLQAWECTPAQLEERIVWATCREEILDRGNAQMRALDKEIALFDVLYVGHRNTFTVSQGQ